MNIELKTGILDILRNDWGGRCGKFDTYWFGYEALKDALHENSIYADIATIKVTMKELEKENKVKLRPTYDDDYNLNGRGWFAI